MADVRDATETILTDRPDLEDALRDVLSVDAESETWTFADVPLDSGEFGELVSRGIVEEADGEYRLSDPGAVRAVLDGEDHVGDASGSVELPDRSLSLGGADVVTSATIVGLLGLTAVMRTVFSWDTVFRGEYVVLTGNDPYRYRYWVEELVRTAPPLGGMPDALLNGDVLMMAVMWGVSTLLGGTAKAVGLVLAVYPVVAALVVGLLVYGTAAVAFDDRRVGLASLALFAVTPAVAYRMSLGFGDHHAFDYIWVALALFSLVLLATERRDWRVVTPERIGGAIGLAVAVAAQVHAWRGGPLLLLPIGAYVAVRVASDVRTERSPVGANAWTLGGLLLAAPLTLGPQLAFGWLTVDNSFTPALYRALAPALLLAGALVVAGVAESVWRANQSARVALGVELVGGLAVAVAAWFVVPAFRAAFQEGFRYFRNYGQKSIAETAPLFSAKFGWFVGPFYFFGLVFFFGLGALVWTSRRVAETHRPGWLVVTVYAWLLFGGTLGQVRFAGPLAIPLSVFGGLAFVYLAAVTDMTDRPRALVVANEREARLRFRGEDAERRSLSVPDRSGLLNLGLLFLFVSGVGVVQTPVTTNELTISDATFDAALGIDRHAAAEEVGWPQSYVLSEWDRNHVYNYYVNGRSRPRSTPMSYAYARDNYDEFVTATDPEGWYRKLSSKPTGYVVMRPYPGTFAPRTMQTRLWDNWGSASDGVAGVGHYRAVYANDDRKVFELVEGAIVVGRAAPGETATVRTQFEAGGETHTYERRPTATANGRYAVRVPYAGEYTVSGESQRVSEAAVRDARVVGETGANARWPLNASEGDVAFDVVGGHHGRIHGANWTETEEGTALSFDGNDSVVVSSADSLSGDRQFSVSVTFRTRGGTDHGETAQLAGTVPATSPGSSSGHRLLVADGHVVATVGDTGETVRLSGPRVDDGQWHTATLVRDGGEVRLVLDGTAVAEDRYAGTLPTAETFVIGSTAERDSGYVGAIRDVSFRNETA